MDLAIVLCLASNLRRFKVLYICGNHSSVLSRSDRRFQELDIYRAFTVFQLMTILEEIRQSLIVLEHDDLLGRVRQESNINNRNVKVGDIMTRSRIFLVTLSLMVVTASLASTAYAICPDCATQDWTSSANNFLEGNPINDNPSNLSTPQQNRLRNADFNSNLLKTNTSNPASSTNNLAPASTLNTATLNMSTLNINLNNINAMPNPVNSGSPVMITTSFGNSSSNSQGIPATNITAYATIKDSSGLKVGEVNLEHTSGDEYAGIWNANTIEGVYKATIVASASGTSKTFTDALQIEVNGSKK
ncbi:MAG: hypothetical protein ABR985_00880 [Methanotrichaceae archaeon]|jgi:hypothetical protein